MSDPGVPKTPNGAPRVFLVGAGPGDPGLLTLRGAQALAMADVLLYDHLVPTELLDLAPERALRIDAGKVRNHPRMSQQEIGEALVEHARRGAIVVRLKGGDPFLFGRGGEEAQILAQAGIPFAIVPGVTSPIAVPAYAGIPVTHRDHSSRLVVLTAHDDPEKWDEEDIKALARPRQTLVVLMGALYMKGLVLRLLKAGLPAKTPTAIVRWGTTPLQESFFNDLGDLPSFLDRNKIAPPAILTIGEVVSLRNEVAWTHRLPLFGKRLLLTREGSRSTDLAGRLEALGATVLPLPTIRISPLLPEKSKDLRERLGDFQWIVFLSPNGVRTFIESLKESGRDLRSLAGIRIFSMGPATGEALKNAGILPDLSPGESHGKGVVSAFRDLSGEHHGKVLLIRGDRGTGTIPRGLEELGYHVETMAVYENTLPVLSEEKKERIRPLLSEGAIDLAIYYSPSAFTGLLSLFPDQKEAIGRLPALAIGPTTREELDKAHVHTVCMAAHPTTDSIVETALDFLSAFGNNAEGRQPPPVTPAGQTQGEMLP
ncbi:MAG: uroporphyrinogen-III C-methyltransferase [Leptospirales bacterium]